MLLVAEAWVYLALVVVEMFSEIIPAIQMNLIVFRAFDLAIGASFNFNTHSSHPELTKHLT